MKVILRADVDNLGRLGDIVTVKPGYGRNYLLPQGLASLATPSNLKVFEQERKKLEAKNNALRAAAQELADKLAAAQVRIEVRVGENDKLYGSVTSTQIAEALAAQGIEVDRRKILLAEPIRSLGLYTVEVKLHPEVVATLQVEIAKPGQPAAQEPAADAPTEAIE
ncbi:50S ribosomal protein L9 [Thermodesulfomicrobium sp. WS]|uniref:50S ribosomal protein L9 n=1 Tax=Thermodesulfomicrobium sp. WS TaxID=3004129 RepID=UPI002492819C|nr:50S ribosomal protein L9 [Thermodesulfomicrobium sp. WS]